MKTKKMNHITMVLWVAVCMIGFAVIGCGSPSKRTPSVDSTDGQSQEQSTQIMSGLEESVSEDTETSEEEMKESSQEETSTEEWSTEETSTEETSETESMEEETSDEQTEEESVIEETEETTIVETTSVQQGTVEIPPLGTVRIGSLKGPTSMGLVTIMEAQEQGITSQNYEFTMVTAADELVAMVASGKVDIALLPANVASVLYCKTNGKVKVIDINTLGVLYLVEDGKTIQSIQDLKGKTVYMTGKGTTPEYCMRYLLEQNGLTEADVTLEFKSEATEVASILAQTEGAIGMLPQPFVTTAMMNNNKLRIALNLSEEWDKTADSSMVTGVTIVQKSFLEQQAEAVLDFVADHQYSVAAGMADLEKTAQLIEKFGIIKAPIAQKAYPYCNIVCITGEEMKQALSGYLNVLYEQNPSAIGGSLPENEFYWIP